MKSEEQLGLDSFSVIVGSESVANCEEELTERLKHPTDMMNYYLTGIAAIAVVGKIFQEKFRRYLAYPVCELSIVQASFVQVGVSESDYQRAIRAIYNAFVESIMRKKGRC